MQGGGGGDGRAKKKFFALKLKIEEDLNKRKINKQIYGPFLAETLFLRKKYSYLLQGKCHNTLTKGKTQPEATDWRRFINSCQDNDVNSEPGSGQARSLLHTWVAAVVLNLPPSLTLTLALRGWLPPRPRPRRPLHVNLLYFAVRSERACG